MEQIKNSNNEEITTGRRLAPVVIPKSSLHVLTNTVGHDAHIVPTFQTRQKGRIPSAAEKSAPTYYQFVLLIFLHYCDKIFYISVFGGFAVKRLISLISLFVFIITALANGAVLYADDADFVFETINGSNGDLMLAKYKGDDELVVVPEEHNGHSVTAIANSCFENKQNVKEIHFPKTVTEIRSGSFYSCISCESYVVDKDNPVYCSEDGVIYSRDMTKLCFCPENYQQTTFVVKDGITEIGELAFRFHPIYSASNQGSPKIEHIVFPETLQKIGSYAFSGARIKEYVFPDSVTELGNDVLTQAEGYTKVHIGAGMMDKYGVSCNCSTLTEISVSPNNEYLTVENNTLFSKDKKILYCVPSGLKLTTYRVPDGVETIENRAFFGCKLKNIDFNEVKTIKTAFGDWGGITDWVFPKSVTSARNVTTFVQPGINSITVLNPECDFSFAFSSFESIKYNITVYGFNGSTAEQFVKNNTRKNVKMTFVALHTDDTESDIHSSAHSYKGTVVAPTCTERGYTHYVCEVCGIEYNDEYTDALGHDYKPSSIVAPTCTEQGYTVCQCSRCPSTERINFTAPTGHNMAVEESVEATCSESGYIRRRCLSCGEAATDYIDAVGHRYEKGSVIAPTCTANGFTRYECEICGEAYETDYKAPLGHKYVTSVTPADFENSGSRIVWCQRCKGVKSNNVISKIKSVSISRTSYVYSAKGIELPEISAVSENGKRISADNYTVTYSSRATGKRVKAVKAVGQYKATVTFKNNYAGEKVFYFFVKPEKVQGLSLSTRGGSITAKWKKDATASGYELVTSTDKGFTKNVRTFTIKNNSSVSKTIKGLKKGRKYYFKIRSFKKIKVDSKSTKMYSDYSKAKSIACK